MGDLICIVLLLVIAWVYLNICVMLGLGEIISRYRGL